MHRLAPLALVLTLWLAFSSVASAAPTPAPGTPAGFTGNAHAVLKFNLNGAPIVVTAHVTTAQRDALSRFDVTVDRNQMPLLPAGPVTLVVDQSKKTVTFWNDATKMYYVQSIAPGFGVSPTPAPSVTPAARPTPPARSPLADLDVLALTVGLGGHSTIVGLATTGITTTLDVRKKGSTTTAHLHASMDLADDFAFFPVTISATIDPGTGASGTIDYAVDDFVRVTPALTAFDVPAGYQKADTIFGIFARAMPAMPSM
jgi:hypothetical protein